LVPILRRAASLAGIGGSAAGYARCSTRDKHQDPELQLVPMREHAARQGWETREYVDLASASDLAGRVQWKRVLAAATMGDIELVFVWALDRAFRSTVHCLSTIERLQADGVGFATLTQPIDTSSPVGQLTLAILAAVAQFEKEMLRQRVVEGLANARRKGSRLGRPPVTERAGFDRDWRRVRQELDAGQLSRRAAAKRLGISEATIRSLLGLARKSRAVRRRRDTQGHLKAA
jgi:putative DNA-invertase from lambdoid prophage Rac